MKQITCIYIILFCLVSLTLEQQANTNERPSASKEERLNEIKRRRKQLQEKYAEEIKDDGKDQAFQKDGQISKTQQIKKQEREAFIKQAKEVRSPDILTKEYLFETQKQMDEFVINLPQNQEIGMHIKIYVNEDNTYGEIQDVDREPPLRVYVYENNNRIIVQKQFYFEGIVKFSGKKDSTYTIRYYNTGKQKLISVTQNYIIQNQHVQNLLSGDDAKKHGEKAKRMYSDFKTIFTDMQRLNAIAQRNGRKYNQKVRYYTVYQVIELVICLGVCFTQVTFIKNLLKGSSIV